MVASCSLFALGCLEWAVRHALEKVTEPVALLAVSSHGQLIRPASTTEASGCLHRCAICAPAGSSGALVAKGLAKFEASMGTVGLAFLRCPNLQGTPAVSHCAVLCKSHTILLYLCAADDPTRGSGYRAGRAQAGHILRPVTSSSLRILLTPRSGRADQRTWFDLREGWASARLGDTQV